MAQLRQTVADRLASSSSSSTSPSAPAPDIGIRIPQPRNPHHRIRRPAKLPRRLPALAAALLLSLALLAALLSLRRLSPHHPAVPDPGSAGDWGNRSLPQKQLKFGHGSAGGGRDSRYWDRDDRRRDHDYDEQDAAAHGGDTPRHELAEKAEGKAAGGGLYNEGGRAELDSYKEEFEESLRSEEGEVSFEDEYDDGIDSQEDVDEVDEEDGGGEDESVKVSATKEGKSVSSEVSRKAGGGSRRRAPEKKSGSKRKPKHHKFTVPSGSSCEMKFLNSTAKLVEPVENKKFSRFSLHYTDVEERPSGIEIWEPRFSGHQSLEEREQSFYAHDQRINCGFVKSPKGLPSTGFDLAEDDAKFMSSCHIAVSSCIFGNSDRLRSPFGKTITRESKKNVCFVMFLDEITLKALLSEGQKMDSGGFIGLWRIVVVKNLPYTDMRRVGKIPKFLTHRLFPSARYSIWLDSKLRLQRDPYLILEYFLWRRGHEYAISNHYDRHCVSEEVMQNKKLNKFNHTIIDQQYQFYQSDGLKKFDASDPNKLLPSYVPEGSFIVRTHSPMSNLFSCLWFNEVDRFTPRDQLSFAYTYLKLRRMNPRKPLHLNMFKDCERRSIAKLFRHRAEEKRGIPEESAR